MNLSSLSQPNRLVLFLGTGVALLLLFVVVTWSIKSQNFQSAQTFQSQKRQLTSEKTKPVSHFLTVDQPENNAVLESPNLTVSGKTSAESTVVLIAGEVMQMVDVGAGGNFNFNITLSEGATIIDVSSFGQDGEEQNVSREVFYSTEEI